MAPSISTRGRDVDEHQRGRDRPVGLADGHQRRQPAERRADERRAAGQRRGHGRDVGGEARPCRSRRRAPSRCRRGRAGRARARTSPRRRTPRPRCPTRAGSGRHRGAAGRCAPPRRRRRWPRASTPAPAMRRSCKRQSVGMWDFSTEPEFQAKLDWMRTFVREEVEPLDLLFPTAGAPYDVRNKKARAILQAAAGAGEGRRGCGPATSAPSSAGRATARSSSPDQRDPRPLLLGADGVRHRRARHRQRRDPRHVRHRRAEGALPAAAARRRHRLLLLDDRAAGRRRPEGVHLPRHAGRATSG